jgi:hypothetical protein
MKHCEHLTKWITLYRDNVVFLNRRPFPPLRGREGARQSVANAARAHSRLWLSLKDKQ